MFVFAEAEGIEPPSQFPDSLVFKTSPSSIRTTSNLCSICGTRTRNVTLLGKRASLARLVTTISGRYRCISNPHCNYRHTFRFYGSSVQFPTIYYFKSGRLDSNQHNSCFQRKSASIASTTRFLYIATITIS